MQYLTDSKYHDIASNVKSYQDCSDLVYLDPSSARLINIAIAVYSFWDLLASITILRLFIKKLALLSLAFNEIDVLIKDKMVKSKKNLNRHRKNQFFLSLVIKTTNIVILTMISSWIAMLSAGARIGTYWHVIAHVITVLAIYMMYSEKTYSKVCCCSNICNDCCIRMCYCCCLRPRHLPQALQLEVNTSHDDNGKRVNSCDVHSQETKSDPNTQSPSTQPMDSDVILVPVLTMGLNSIFSAQSKSMDTVDLTAQVDTVSDGRNSPSIHSHDSEDNMNMDKAEDEMIYIEPEEMIEIGVSNASDKEIDQGQP